MEAALRAEAETRRASGMRITYLPGPLDRRSNNIASTGSDPEVYDGAWKCCDGVLCTTYPDLEWGREFVLDWVKQHLK